MVVTSSRGSDDSFSLVTSWWLLLFEGLSIFGGLACLFLTAVSLAEGGLGGEFFTITA